MCYSSARVAAAVARPMSAEAQVSSGLDGKAIASLSNANFPTTKQILAAIPPHCYNKPLWRSMMYAVISTTLTLGTALLAYNFIPLTAAALPLWVAYAAINGTIATGCWVSWNTSASE